MNAFFEHHKDNVQFGYRCFDRILLNGLIQPFQQPEPVLDFFNAYREGTRVTRRLLTEIADQFHTGTSASATISMRSSAPSASRSRREPPQPEQNSGFGRYNGN